MGWFATILSGLFGGGRNIIAETAGAFRPNAEAASARDGAFQQAALAQMAAEFQGGSGWFNGLVDGLNRLPRPLLAFGCIGLLTSAMTDPVWFASRMQGLTLVPDPLWTLLGAIIAFYFGARELSHFRAGSMRKEAARILEQAPAVAQNIRTLEALRANSPGVADPGRDAGVALASVEPDANPALDELRQA